MSNGYSNGPAVQRTDAAIDQGLRSFFLRTFNIMALGVALTGLVAWFVGSQYISTAMGETVALSGLIQVLYGTPLKWALVFAPLGLSFLFGGAIWVSRPAVSHAMFWTFCTVFALAVVPLLASFMVTAVDKIFLAFLMSAFGFLSLSIYGYTTKADLTSWVHQWPWEMPLEPRAGRSDLLQRSDGSVSDSKCHSRWGGEEEERW